MVLIIITLTHISPLRVLLYFLTLALPTRPPTLLKPLEVEEQCFGGLLFFSPLSLKNRPPFHLVLLMATPNNTRNAEYVLHPVPPSRSRRPL